MAYDKVVDSSVLDAGLKAIANAIREKGGTSDNLAFPTAMAEAILDIQAGGSGAKLPAGYAMECGVYIPAEDVYRATVTLENTFKNLYSLSLGTSFVCVCVLDLPQNTDSVFMGFNARNNAGKSFSVSRYISATGSVGSYGNTYANLSTDGKQVNIGYDSHLLVAGVSYFWIVVAEVAQ